MDSVRQAAIQLVNDHLDLKRLLDEVWVLYAKFDGWVLIFAK